MHRVRQLRQGLLLRCSSADMSDNSPCLRADPKTQILGVSVKSQGWKGLLKSHLLPLFSQTWSKSSSKKGDGNSEATLSCPHCLGSVPHGTVPAFLASVCFLRVWWMWWCCSISTQSFWKYCSSSECLQGANIALLGYFSIYNPLGKGKQSYETEPFIHTKRTSGDM